MLVQVHYTSSIFKFCMSSTPISVHAVGDSSQEQPCISGFLSFKLVSDLKYMVSVLFLVSTELLCPYPWQMDGEQKF